MRLADICLIQMGYTARKRWEPASVGGVLALQLRDVSSDGDLRLETAQRVERHDIADRYLVSDGDIVFRSRGDSTIATVVTGIGNEKVAAILPLIILRPDRSVVTPDFVAWSINLPASQRHLDSNAQGGSIRMVSKSALDDLSIDVPDLTSQQRIVTAASLARREAALTASLADKHLTLTTTMLADAAKRRSANRPSERSTP